MKLQELTRRVDALHALLHDPQEGLMSWCMALGDNMTQLVARWQNDPAPAPPAEKTLRQQILFEASEGLDKLDRIYAYIETHSIKGEDPIPTLRLVVRSQAMWRATVANFILGKAHLPHPSWELPLDKFPPQCRPHFLSHLS